MIFSARSLRAYSPRQDDSGGDILYNNITAHPLHRTFPACRLPLADATDDPQSDKSDAIVVYRITPLSRRAKGGSRNYREDSFLFSIDRSGLRDASGREETRNVAERCTERGDTTNAEPFQRLR